MRTPPALFILIPLTSEQNPLALLIADTMHAASLTVDVLLDGDSLKSMMRRAHKMGASHALIIGEERNRQAKTVMVKNLMTGHQETVAQIDVVPIYDDDNSIEY